MKKSQFIPGYHSVLEALGNKDSGIQEIWIQEGKGSPRINEIMGLANRAHIPVFSKSPAMFSRAMPGMSHQGIAALMEGFLYTHLEKIIDMTQKIQEEALIIAADHITDEGNLGAIIRTAEFFGAHGLVIPKDRSAEVTHKVMKRSSGACVNLPIARVVNMARSLRRLREKGFWVIGTSDNAAQSIWTFDWKRDVTLVMGSEQKGLGPAVKKCCHEMLKIPGYGKIQSLNVAVACGVILSEIRRQRQSK